MTTIYAVIPTFNRLNHTKECLLGLMKQKRIKLKIVVVDSGSTDGTIVYLRKKFSKKVTLIQGNQSWWWTKCTAAGVNFALRNASDLKDYVLILNNDCYARDDYLLKLMATAKTNPKYIVGSLCLDCDNNNRVVEAGIKLDWRHGLITSLTEKYGDDTKDYRSIKLLTKIDALPGKGTLIPMKAFHDLGNFRSRLPHYLVDYEFTNRAKQAGYKLVINPRTVLYHHWRATGNGFSWQKSLYSLKEAVYLILGRKSMNNLLDWLNFVWLTCPDRYRLRNLKFTCLRLLAGLAKVTPFRYFLPEKRLWRLLLEFGLKIPFKQKAI